MQSVSETTQALNCTANYARDKNNHTIALRVKLNKDVFNKEPISFNLDQQQQFEKLFAQELISSFALSIEIEKPRISLEDIDDIECKIDKEGYLNLSKTYTVQDPPITFENREFTLFTLDNNFFHQFLSQKTEELTLLAERSLSDIAMPLLNDAIVCDSVGQFFKTASILSSTSLDFVQHDKALSQLADNPKAMNEIDSYLSEFNINKVKLLSAGTGYSMIFETDGNVAVRISSLKETRDVIDAPEVLQPYFTKEFDDVRIDIVPHMKVKATGKVRNDMTKAVSAALLQTENPDKSRYIFYDDFPKNLMLLEDGTPLVVDLGSVLRVKYSDALQRQLDISAQLQTEIPYSWVTDSGTLKQHEAFPLLTLEHSERIVALQQSLANYDASTISFEEWIEQQSKLSDRLGIQQRAAEKVKQAYEEQACEMLSSIPDANVTSGIIVGESRVKPHLENNDSISRGGKHTPPIQRKDSWSEQVGKILSFP